MAIEIKTGPNSYQSWERESVKVNGSYQTYYRCRTAMRMMDEASFRAMLARNMQEDITENVSANEGWIKIDAI